MNFATQLTFFRILLVPFFMYYVLQGTEKSLFIGLVIFVIASITDFFDGYIARKFNQVTKLGKLLDPLADKILVAAALICLVELRMISSWPVVIILSREFIISIFRALAATEGIVIAASWWGKWKTNSQIFAIILLLLGNYPFNNINIPMDQIMIYVATILTIISGVDYIYKNRSILKE